MVISITDIDVCEQAFGSFEHTSGDHDKSGDSLKESSATSWADVKTIKLDRSREPPSKGRAAFNKYSVLLDNVAISCS